MFCAYFSDSGLGIGGGGGNRDEPDRVYVVEMGNSVSSTSSTSFRSVTSVWCLKRAMQNKHVSIQI